MRTISILPLIIAIALTVSFCGGKAEMTTLDFIKIEDEILKTDLTPASKEAVAKKFGFSLEQYQTFEERARTDQKLQEELGKIRLKPKE